MLEMGGGLSITNTARSLIFDEQLLEPGMKFSSSQLEAVYAIPFESAKVSVIITNTTSQPLTVSGDAIFADATGHHPINSQLSGYESEVIDLPKGLVKKAPAGAVSLSHTGEPGALLAMIHVQDEDKGFSTAVNFTDPAQGKTTAWHGAGLRLGHVFGDALKPVIAVRNLGSEATTVTARVPYSKQDGNTGTIALPQVSLTPGEIRLLNTSNPQLSQPDFATAGLELDYTGAPGSVIASALSVSQSGTHVFTLPLKDPQGGLSSTGGYPWFTNGSASTVVFIKNTTAQPRQFHVTLSYQGDKWGSNLKTLAPGQTYLLDVRQVRDEQEAGSDGSLIPPDATSGHVAWSVRGSENKVLIGRAQTVDFAVGLASSYECQCTCPASFDHSFMSPGSVTGFPGSTQQFLANEVDRNCYGTLQAPYTVLYPAFSSGNTSVATVSSTGVATAIAPGSTTINAFWSTPGRWQFYGPEFPCGWEPADTECSGYCSVYPSITGPSTIWWFGGENPPNYSTSVTLTASSASSGSFTWEIISGTNQLRFDDNSTTKVTSSNQVTVKTISFSTSPNQIGVRVTVNGFSSPTLQMTSRVPYQMEPVGAPTQLAHSEAVYRSIYKYRILDQFGVLLPFDVPINERFIFPISVDYPGMNWEPSIANGFVIPPGDIADLMEPGRFSGQVPTPTFPLLPLGTIKVFHRSQEWYIGSVLIGIGRRVQDNVQQYYVDHAAHENVVTPYPNP
jgi:hypothetical protein